MEQELVATKAQSSSRLYASIEKSQQETIGDENKDIWVGLFWFLLGLAVFRFLAEVSG